MSADRPPRILSIQYLRALAAFAVVANHTGWTHSVVGAAGVDLFFVISGFVMVLVSGRATPAAFLQARIARLVPLYWTLTLVAAVAQHATMRHTLLSMLFWPHNDGAGSGMPVVWQGWTLNYEMFFYAVFTLTLLLPARRRLTALACTLAALVLAGLAIRPDNQQLAVYTSPLLLEFLAGAGIYAAAKRGWLTPALSVAAVSAGVLAFAAEFPLPDPGAWRALLWGLPSAAIVAGCVGCERAGFVPSVRPLRLLGDASYSIYLGQAFLLGWVLPYLKPLPGPLAICGALAACATGGLALYLGLERPLLAIKSRRRAPAAQLARLPLS